MVVVQLPVEGSYNAQEDKEELQLPPPITNTLPLLNKVAVCSFLAVANDVVAVQAPVEGSYNSQDDKVGLPPVTNTLPLLNKVTV